MTGSVGIRNRLFRFALIAIALICFSVSCLYDGIADGANEQSGTAGVASAASSGQAGTINQVEGEPIELDEPSVPSGSKLPGQTLENDDVEYDAKIITEADWAKAIERILDKGASAPQPLNIAQGRIRNSSLKSKDGDGLHLETECGFRISIKSADYSGENEVEVSSIVTPNWTYQATASGRNFILFDDYYKNYEDLYGDKIKVLYPAGVIGYSHAGAMYYAVKDFNDDGTAMDSESVAGTWQYKVGKTSMKTWKKDSSGSSAYEGLCDLLKAIQGSFDSAVRGEDGLTFELNGFVYMEKGGFDSFKDEIACEMKLAFGDSAPESAKIARPVKIVFSFNGDKEISLISSSLIVGEKDEPFIVMSGIYGNKEMRIEYLDNFECTVDDLPESSLDELGN